MQLQLLKVNGMRLHSEQVSHISKLRRLVCADSMMVLPLQTRSRSSVEMNSREYFLRTLCRIFSYFDSVVVV